MLFDIGGADYSHRYRLQLIPLLIGSITSITDVSVQLYHRTLSQAFLSKLGFIWSCWGWERL